MSENAILTVSGLTAGYGEILCLVGESGCGKSTLLRALLGVTPKLRIRSGSVMLDGTELTALPDKARQAFATERMGMVFQSPGASFMPIRSYRAQFIETLKCHGKYRAADFESEAAGVLAKRADLVAEGVGADRDHTNLRAQSPLRRHAAYKNGLRPLMIFVSFQTRTF